MPAPGSLRGRFAPSPTGPLHLGNLRTALLSWLQARSMGGSWIVRMEDLDRMTSSTEHETGQLADLAELGLVPDGPVVRQSERFDLHREAIAQLAAMDRVYECYCTRREIREAAHAPHGDDVPYPQTCRSLTSARRSELRAEGRRPALRLRALDEEFTVHDLVAGTYTGIADDVVLQRNDGVPAYNLAVVVDDAAQGITHVLRGDDLLSSTPRQRLLQHLLGLPEPVYAHVPLVLAPDGSRLAKRHGAVTLADLRAQGMHSRLVLARLGASIGLCDPADDIAASDLLARFEIKRIPTAPWRLQPGEL